MPKEPVATKIVPTERMLNLVIALLGTTRGRSRHYIRQNVNGYAKEASTRAEEATLGPAFERMFERDKDLLRDVGIPISTISIDDDEQEQILYRINPVDYRVPEIRLDEDAMSVLAVAASLWSDAALSEAAQSALRKVSIRAGLGWYDDDATLQSRIRTLEPSFEPLWAALRDSHTVRFSYRSTHSGETTERTVQPWGLGNKYGQWYLSGFDVEKEAQRNFRLSRIRSEVSADSRARFERPRSFSISAVLDSLGTDTAQTCLVKVPKGAAHGLRSREGSKVVRNTDLMGNEETTDESSAMDTLSIRYREPELMADDLAALGAQATVLSPELLRTAVISILRSAFRAGETLGGSSSSTDSIPSLGTVVKPLATKRSDSRDRLLRLLAMVPFLVANPGVDVEEICAEFSINQRELERDLDTLMVSGLPGYQHGELMDVTLEHGQVFIADAETLASPLRLTQDEACALLVGLEALRRIPGTTAAKSLEIAISQLQHVAGESAWLAEAVALQLLSGQELETIITVQAMIRDSQAAKVNYVVRSRDEITRRIIEPRRIFSLDSTWYVRAWCRSAGGLRSFRVDQLASVVAAGMQTHMDIEDVGEPAAAYHPNSADLELELIADSATAHSLASAYGASLHELQADVRTDLQGLRIRVGETRSIPPLMARMAGHARVVRPASQAQMVQEWLASALANYELGENDHAVGESAPDTFS